MARRSWQTSKGQMLAFTTAGSAIHLIPQFNTQPSIVDFEYATPSPCAVLRWCKSSSGSTSVVLVMDVCSKEPNLNVFLRNLQIRQCILCVGWTRQDDKSSPRYTNEIRERALELGMAWAECSTFDELIASIWKALDVRPRVLGECQDNHTLEYKGWITLESETGSLVLIDGTLYIVRCYAENDLNQFPITLRKSNSDSKLHGIFANNEITWEDGTVWKCKNNCSGYLTAWNWFRTVGYQECLTINDVLEFPLNQEIQLLSLHRNWSDESPSSHGYLSDPLDFFRNSKATFTHFGDLKGNWVANEWNWDEFEFDLEYEEGHWYPLEGGVLSLENDKRWQDFPRTTRVGFRGPAILLSKVHALPPVIGL
eukprot:c2991_g1_i1.p1 GENE.c2991_g1_i1~~c2991_g1_i1.p1  ORF type:complete len:368 (-),score=74.30 c2991_g1_i1:81-1184(-)